MLAVTTDNIRLVKDDIVKLSHTPLSFGTWSSLFLDFAVAPQSISQFQDFFSLFFSTYEPWTGDNPGGVDTTSTVLQIHKWQIALGLYHCSIRGVTTKYDICRFYGGQYGDFPSFSFLFLLEKDANLWEIDWQSFLW